MKTITMKKNVFKLAVAALVFFLGVNVVNAQPETILNDYRAVEETVLQTVNRPFRLYVWPDPVFSPDYNENTNLGINPLSLWRWTIDNVDGDEVEPASNNNWVELTPTEQGTTTYNVVETFNGLECNDEGTTRTVQVIDVPYVRFDVGGAETFMGLENVLASGCSDIETAINVLFANTNETGNYHINLNYAVYNANIDGSGDIEFDPVDDLVATPTVNYDYSEGSPLVITDVELLGSEVYGLEGDAITVYEFTLAGWNAGISRKSDYFSIMDAGDPLDQYSSYTYYSDKNEDEDVLTAYIVVLPQPSTGPIYHIPNDFNEF